MSSAALSVGVVIFMTKFLSCAWAAPAVSASDTTSAPAADAARDPSMLFEKPISSSRPGFISLVWSAVFADQGGRCPACGRSPDVAASVRAQQRAAGHFLGLRQFHQLEQGRR